MVSRMTESERQKVIHDLEYLVSVYSNNPEKQNYYKKQLKSVKKSRYAKRL